MFCMKCGLKILSCFVKRGGWGGGGGGGGSNFGKISVLTIHLF